MFYDFNGNPLQRAYDFHGNLIADSTEVLILSAVDDAESRLSATNGTRIAYMTDAHLSGTGQLMQMKNTVDSSYSVSALNEICKRGLVDAVVIGGDMINAYAKIPSGTYPSTKNDAKARMRQFINMIDAHGIPIYFVKGNHDLNAKYDEVMGYADYPNRINDEDWQELTEQYETNAVFNPSDKAGYFYVDLSNDVRLAIWNQYTGNTIDTSGSDGNGTSNVEKNWFRDVVFDNSKTVISIWHNPEYWATYQGMYPRYFADGGRYDGKQWEGGGKTFCINSHTHADNLGYLFDGTMFQNVPNFNVRNSYAVTASTATNQHIDEGLEKICVSIFTIGENHVWETRVGNGTDRESDFCTVTA